MKNSVQIELFEALNQACLYCLVKEFNAEFESDQCVRLVPGYEEPFYLAPANKKLGEIRFKGNGVRSALHEIAHWCIAGETRLKKDDFGYWYTPDGRDLEKQREFYQVEARPQALEKMFCEVLGIYFEPSLDNLGGLKNKENEMNQLIEDFLAAMKEAYKNLKTNQLALRTQRVVHVIEKVSAIVLLREDQLA